MACDDFCVAHASGMAFGKPRSGQHNIRCRFRMIHPALVFFVCLFFTDFFYLLLIAAPCYLAKLKVRFALDSHTN